MFQPTELSLPDVKPLIDIAFTLTGNMNLFWNYFLVFSGVVIGWRFSAKDQWGSPQKWIVTGVYTLFAFLNGWALLAIYDWLEKVFLDVNSTAGRLSNQYPHLKEVMEQSAIVGGKPVAAIIYVGGWLLVLTCVWAVKYTGESENKSAKPSTPQTSTHEA
jgi:hypothetical protein